MLLGFLDVLFSQPRSKDPERAHDHGASLSPSARKAGSGLLERWSRELRGVSWCGPVSPQCCGECQCSVRTNRVACRETGVGWGLFAKRVWEILD